MKNLAENQSAAIAPINHNEQVASKLYQVAQDGNLEAIKMLQEQQEKDRFTQLLNNLDDDELSL